MLCRYIQIYNYRVSRTQNNPETHRKRNDGCSWLKKRIFFHVQLLHLCKFCNPSPSKPPWSTSNMIVKMSSIRWYLVVKLDVLLLRKWNFRLKSQTAWIWALETIMWQTCIIMILNEYYIIFKCSRMFIQPSLSLMWFQFTWVVRYNLTI